MGVALLRGYTCIETNLLQPPTFGSTDRAGKGQWIEVRIGRAEDLSRRMEQVLPVDEGDGPLDPRLSGHYRTPERQYPAGGLAACPTGSK